MSNRGRQNVASFLTKNLYLDWRYGAEVFESLLIDHDPSLNYGNWQYVAGVGNDPRTDRKFNMIKQAMDYDPQMKFVKTWIPVLEKVEKLGGNPHMPWLMDGAKNVDGNLVEYPPPLVIDSAWNIHSQRQRGRQDHGGNNKNHKRSNNKMNYKKNVNQ